MKTTDFRKILTSVQLKENINKQFGIQVNLEKYSREQLEDMRNKLRTRVFQQEGQSKVNELLTNETYQKDKAMLALLNTRIKEMLGEDIKKLRDKMDDLSEAKKGVRAPKYAKHSKGGEGAKAAKDYDGDGKVETPKDEVWGSRAKAAAKAGKPFGKKEKEVEEAVASRRVKGKGYDDPEKSDKPLTGTVPDNPWHDARGAKFMARQAKGTLVKGRAQSAPQPKNPIDKDIDESEDKKPSAGMTKKEKSAVVKKAKAGKGFAKVEKAAKESVESFKKNVRLVNESLSKLLTEDEEGKAKAITAASDIVNDYTSWMQRVGQYQTKAMVELSDAIRADFGAQQAEQFKSSVAPALEATLATLMAQREAISNAVAVLAGEETAVEPMGAEPAATPVEPGMEPAEPDMMNEPGAADEFAASDAAAGAGETGREMRESRFHKKLAESHSIISKLAK